MCTANSSDVTVERLYPPRQKSATGEVYFTLNVRTLAPYVKGSAFYVDIFTLKGSAFYIDIFMLEGLCHQIFSMRYALLIFR